MVDETTGNADASKNPLIPSGPLPHTEPQSAPEALQESTPPVTPPIKKTVLPTPNALPTPLEGTPPVDPIHADMQKILGELKIPERHNQMPKEEPPKRSYDTTLADPTRELPRPAPGFSPPEASTQQPTAPGDSISIHTFKDDLQHVVRDNKISYIRAVALEEERKQKINARSPLQTDKRSLFTLFVVLILLGMGLLALGAVYVVMQQRTTESNAALRSNVLFAEQSVPFPVDNQAPADVRRTLASARNSGSLTLGAILQIIPVRTADDPATGGTYTIPLSFEEFLTALGTRAPAELPRALESSFFFGIHTVDENAPVIIVPVTSYERAFAGMLEWEATMNADLEPLFTQLPPQSRNPGGVITERVFEDTVMRNYDVRALKDDTGAIQLYYSFPTRNVLIIAESPYSFTEILSRLRADRRL